MSLIHVLFPFFVALTAIAGGAILLSRNVFRSALWLLVCLLSIAALYVLTMAEFLAVTQILIYAGGILVIILFGIMLTTRISGKPLVVGHRHVLSGIVVAVGLFILLCLCFNDLEVGEATLTPEPITAIALHLFSRFVLPFELAGILLLVALVGAAVTASQLDSKS